MLYIELELELKHFTATFYRFKLSRMIRPVANQTTKIVLFILLQSTLDVCPLRQPSVEHQG